MAEFESRLQDISSGPWHAQSLLARETLPAMSPQDAHRFLRPHYEDPQGIRDREEIRFRESFDQLLEELQLLELAVACGYLPVDVVRSAALSEFETFLVPI